MTLFTLDFLFSCTEIKSKGFLNIPSLLQRVLIAENRYVSIIDTETTSKCISINTCGYIILSTVSINENDVMFRRKLMVSFIKQSQFNEVVSK